MTVKELKERLEFSCRDEDEIIFGCKELEFYRFKNQQEGVVLMEFNCNFVRDNNGTLIVHEISN